MRKIVIIEDNAVVARLYENKLKAAGNTVYIALDGAEGMRLIHEIRPDLVLLDLLLPNKSGIEIIKEIRRDYRFTHLPIMAYSSADEDILAQAVEAGSTTIISKNKASFKEILEHFNNLLEASRHWQIYSPEHFNDEKRAADVPKSAALDRLLIVEDDFMTARIISNIAEKEGLKPVVMSDGQEAYRVLSAEANFAAAILDIELPKIKGTDLLKYMRSEKRLRNIPVVIMTASSDYIKLQIESYESGATFFISKPFERTIIESLLKTIMKRRL
jgi:two-component system response regulator VicR